MALSKDPDSGPALPLQAPGQAGGAVDLAQAAAGQFDVAIATARKALSVEPAASNADFADEINTRIELYEQGKPYVKGSAVE